MQVIVIKISVDANVRTLHFNTYYSRILCVFMINWVHTNNNLRYSRANGLCKDERDKGSERVRQTTPSRPLTTTAP